MYSYAPLSSYPHLSEKESEIWTRFIRAYPKYFDSAEYDVTVGCCLPNEEDLRPEWQRNRQYLGKYKIDVVGWKGGVPYIIELKKEATTKALGEIWLYDVLWRDENPKHITVGNMIITDKEMPNIRDICDKEKVALIIV